MSERFWYAYVITSIFCIIFFIIGIPTIIIGCDESIQPICLNYKLMPVQIVNYQVNIDICCGAVNTNGACLYWYTCYNSYAIGNFKWNSDQKTCLIKVAIGVDSQETALNDAHKYILYSIYNLYVNKNDLTCQTKTDLKNIAIVGIIFLNSSLFLLLIIIILVIIDKCNLCIFRA